MNPPPAGAGQHPRHGLDDVIHAPVRFSIVATLTGVDRAEFAFLRDVVEVSDSVLSKQISVLEQAGYVKVTKGYVGKRPRTWLALTPAGRRAFDAHLEALGAIAALGRPDRPGAAVPAGAQVPAGAAGSGPADGARVFGADEAGALPAADPSSAG